MPFSIQELAEETALALVVGPPGTGKTTYVSRQIAEDVGRGKAVLVASLTKAAARELAGRELPIDPKRVGTLHSHAYHAVGADEIAEKRAKQWNEWCEERGYPRDWHLSVARKVTLDDPMDEGAEGDDENDGQKTKGDETLESIGSWRARMVDPAWWPNVEMRRFYEAWCEWKRSAGFLDFTDLIERCVQERIPPPIEFDALYVDEAQDSSRLETALALQWGALAEKLVICGDPRQNLYEWRGSEPDVFLDLDRSCRARRVLAQSFRVPKAVHAEAVAWVSQLQRDVQADYHPREDEGAVERGWSLRHVERLAEEASELASDGKTVMLLAATKRLADLFVWALRDIGATFHNPYRPQAKRWNPLGDGATSPGQQLLAFSRVNDGVWGQQARFWSPDEIKAWVKPIQADVFQRGAKSRLSAGGAVTPAEFAALVKDRGTLNRMFAGDVAWYVGALTPGQKKGGRFDYPIAVADRHGLRALDEESRITVGTIHSVKGGESDVVYVVPDLSPRGYETWMNTATRDQTVRLMYVAMTRARDRLVLCNSMSSRSVIW